MIAGYQVGIYKADFVHDVGMGGQRLFNAEKFEPQSERSWMIIADRYREKINRAISPTRWRKHVAMRTLESVTRSSGNL